MPSSGSRAAPARRGRQIELLYPATYLLLTGGLTATVATLGVEFALATLAGLGLVGVVVNRTLPEVSKGV